jgi:AAA domain, putative AbiEii toxin, Type IV TA system
MDRLLLRYALSDYRCFAPESNAAIELGHDFVALVGQNNAGKTAFLRSIVELAPLFAGLSNSGVQVSQQAKEQPAVSADPSFVTEQLEIVRNEGDRGDARLPGILPTTVSLDRVNAADVPRDPPTLVGASFTPAFFPGRILAWDLSLRWGGGATPEGGWNAAQSPQATHLTEGRGGRAWPFASLVEWAQWLSRARYIPAVRVAQGTITGTAHGVDAGATFIKNWATWQSGRSHQARRIQQVKADIGRLLGMKTFEAHATPDHADLQITTDDGSHKLATVGSAVGHLLVVLGTVAMQSPSFILIDEPEIGFHPGLQRDFLLTLRKYATHGVIFATHSIGLARSVADRIYAFSRDAQTRLVSVRPFEGVVNLPEFLGELSFSSLFDLGIKTVLLVEGVTDVRVFDAWLRLYNLDNKVAILPLGGNGLCRGGVEDELRQIVKLCSAVVAIVDSERAAPSADPAKERQEFEATCKRVGIRVLLTERRATENYLTDAAVKAVVGSTHSALGLHDELTAWHKRRNWEIASKMTKSDLDSTDVGRFLEALRT